MSDRNYNRNEDLQELLNMLDRMQKRPAPVAEETVSADSDLRDLVQMPAEELPTVDVFDPEPPMVLLSDLLIHPAEQMMEEEETSAPPQEEPAPEEEDLPLPAAPMVKWNPLPALRTLLPAKKDDPILRGVKIGTLATAATVLLVSLLLLLEMVALPWHNRRYNNKLADWYHTANASGVTRPNFPEDMRIAFNKLYRANDDVRGWLTFRSIDGGQLVDIDYPVVQTDNNTTYRNTDFHGRHSRFGTLFFDKNSQVEADNKSSALIIHGNTDGSGQMMSALNRLVGNVQQARLATTITFSNLFEEHEYVVFAVMVLDDEELMSEQRLSLRSQFASNEDFLQYVIQLRAHSLFDYPVNVMDTDRLLLLTTELSGKDYGLKKGRVVVAARRRRDGEMVLNMGTVTRNTDAVMPYRWYVHQGMAVPDIDYGNDRPTTAGSTYYDPFEALTTAPSTTESTTVPTDPWGNPLPTSSDYGDSTTTPTDYWGNPVSPSSDYGDSITTPTDPRGNPVSPSSDYGDSTTSQWSQTEDFGNTVVNSTTTPSWTRETDNTPTRDGVTTSPHEATRTTRDYSAITGPNNNKKED